MSATSGIGRVLAPEGRVNRVMLSILQHVQASVLLMVALIPAFAFHALVGWQATHLALWLGVLALLPAGPGLFALHTVSRAFLLEGSYPGHGVRRFVAAYGRGVAGLWQWWLVVALVGLLLAYNLALYGASDAVLALALVGLAALLALSIGVSCAAFVAPGHGWLSLLAAVGSAGLRRPHVLLSWVFLALLVGGSVYLPVVGVSLPLIAPGLAACAILVVNAATGFDTSIQKALDE